MADRERQVVEGTDLDVRTTLLLRLMSEGLLDVDDVTDILRYTTDYTDPAEIIGMVAGAKGVRPVEIEKALENTEWQVNRSEIERVGVPWKERMKEVGGYLGGAASMVGQYFMWEATAIEGQLSKLDKDDIPDDIFSTDAALHVIPPEYLDEIERLNDDGLLTSSEYKRLRGLAGELNPQSYYRPDQFKAELRKVYGNVDEAEVEGVEARTVIEEQLTEGEPLPEREGYFDEQRDDAGVLRSDRIATDAEIDGIDNIFGGSGSFVDSLVADGVMEGFDDGAVPRERASLFQKDMVFDPSTGQRFSQSEWESIKVGALTGTGARYLNYVENKQVSQPLQDLYNSGRFNVAEKTKWDAKEGRFVKTGEWYKTVSTGGQGHIPVEAVTPSLNPTNPWETSTFDYRAGDGRAEWMTMSSRERGFWRDRMRNLGIFTGPQMDVMDTLGGADLNGMAIWEDVIGLSSETQWDPLTALTALGKQKRANEATSRRSGGGRSAPKYSVPASLREIPDYKTLATETKSIFNQQLGRDMEDWELGVLSDEMKNKYVEQNKQRITAHRAAWEDAVSGGTFEVDFTEVEDPTKGMQFDIEEKYANELDRQERVEDRSNSRNLLMNSITIGQRMI